MCETTKIKFNIRSLIESIRRLNKKEYNGCYVRCIRELQEALKHLNIKDCSSKHEAPVNSLDLYEVEEKDVKTMWERTELKVMLRDKSERFNIYDASVETYIYEDDLRNPEALLHGRKVWVKQTEGRKGVSWFVAHHATEGCETLDSRIRDLALRILNFLDEDTGQYDLDNILVKWEM